MRFRIGPIAAVVLLAGAASAGTPANKTSVKFQQPTAVAGTVVPAGSYSLEVDSRAGTARFTQGKRTVAEAAVKVALEPAVYPGNAVHSKTVDGQERLVKIVLAASGLAIEFPAGAAPAGNGAIAKTAERP